MNVDFWTIHIFILIFGEDPGQVPIEWIQEAIEDSDEYRNAILNQ